MATELEIEPHGGVGALRLGAPRREAHFALGELPTSLATDPESPAVEAWHDFALQAFFDEDDRIEYIEVERGDELRPLLFGAPVLELSLDEVLAVVTPHAAIGVDTPQGIVVPALDLLLWRPREGAEDDDGHLAGVGVGVPGSVARRARAES